MIDFPMALKNTLGIPRDVDLEHPINLHKFIYAVLLFTEDNPQYGLCVASIDIHNKYYIQQYIRLAACTWFRERTDEERDKMKEYIREIVWHYGNT